jgi:hypothetical protein
MDDSSGMTKRVGAALKPISKEMEDRLESDLADRDMAAIRTAILKACIAGKHLGAVETTAQIIEQAPEANVTLNTPQLEDELARFDLWAAEYGGADQVD